MAEQISSRLSLPKRLVARQLVQAFGSTEEEIKFDQVQPVVFDRWQVDASQSRDAALIVGGRGTGKTTAVLARCQFLVKNSGIDPRLIRVFAPTRESADSIRSLLLTSDGGGLTLVSVGTPAEYAYDILTRFKPDLLQLSTFAGKSIVSEVNEPTGSLVSAARSLLITAPGVRDLLCCRFEHVLVDDIDQMSEDACAVIEMTAPGSGRTVWATARGNVFPSSDKFVRPLKSFSLANQYRRSSSLHEFVSSLDRTRPRRELLARPLDPRFGTGSVTITVAEHPEQMMAGLYALLNDYSAQTYARYQIAFVNASAAGTNAIAAWNLDETPFDGVGKYKIVEYVEDLLAFVRLCVQQWDFSAIVRVGRFAEYGVPITDLVKFAREVSSIELFRERIQLLRQLSGIPGAIKLAEHLEACEPAQTVRTTLLRYLFDSAEYLRLNPAAGRAVQEILYHLPQQETVSKSQTVEQLAAAFRGQSTSSKTTPHQPLTPINRLSSWYPIVIVADASLKRLKDILTIGLPNSTDCIEINAAESATDHVVYCVLSKIPRHALSLFRKSCRAYPRLTVLDWSTLNFHPQTSADDRSPRLMSEDLDSQLFRKCPRRVYYLKLLAHDQAPEVIIRSDDYPAKPADGAMCATCDYTALCPAIIN